MSDGVANSMSRKKIQQLLKIVGSEPAEDTQVEATEYNWKESHYFNNEQLVKLGFFTKSAAGAMAQKFSRFFRSGYNVTAASTTQHYVHEFLGNLTDGEQEEYYIAFGEESESANGGCGLVGIPEQVAHNWARQLLGDSGSEKEPGGDLTQLEESLLLDLVSALIEAFSGNNISFDLHTAKGIVKGQWPLEIESTEELCKITFDIKKADSENGSEIYFLILCSKLAPAAGKAEQDSVDFSAEEVSKAILGHLHEMSVLITGQLATTVLTFEEIMDLQVDDILVLDKRIDQPAELIVDGRTFYYGCPAKSAGKHAVTITNMAAEFEDNKGSKVRAFQTK
jgi:flagellar motor switch protein FliM